MANYRAWVSIDQRLDLMVRSIVKCLIMIVVLLSPHSSFCQTSISLDSVAGLYNTDTLAAGTIATFYLRFTNGTNEGMKAISSPFRVYSPDGAAWKSVQIDTIGLSRAQFNFFLTFTYRDTIDHSTPDSMSVIGAIVSGTGLASGYDAVAIAISVDLSDGRAAGKHICIDSCFIPPGGTWKWVGLPSNVDYIPTWDGPHCFFVYDPPSDVEHEGDGLPNATTLSQNFPNPFNPTTEIQYSLKSSTHVRLVVRDLLGREVAVLVDGPKGPGEHSAVWDGRDSNRQSVASGVYLYHIETIHQSLSRKMMLLK